jgi:cell division protease FtsH
MENKNPNQKLNMPPPGSQNKKPNGKSKFNFFWIYGLIFLVFFGAQFYQRNTQKKEVPYSTFQEYVRNGWVEKITVFTSRNGLEAQVSEVAAPEVFGERADRHTDRMITTQTPSADEVTQFIQRAKDEGVFTGEWSNQNSPGFERYLISFLPILLIILVIVYLNRRMMGGGGGGGMGLFSVGKSKAQLFDKSATNKITFKDVAGLEGAKQEVVEIVDFLKKPSKFTQLGGKIPKGALLVGPPGTGKTLLAKAVAGEADVPFFSLSGSDFVEMFVGVGASRVRDLFRQAKEKSPCIIFIDEIDAIGRARARNVNMGGNDERENTLNQLLTEMDGFGTNSGIIILAATNRADILDKALLRAGRFDRQIHVDLPDISERKAIFNVHLRPIKIDETVNVDFLAKQTPGFSGADIANVCNEAALIAARKNKETVGKQDFLDAVDRIVGGLEKKTKITTLSEKRSIAYHEAGHAAISWKLEHANPLFKVTIVPRGTALGAAWYLPEERQLTNKEHLLDDMCSALGGRASEEVFLHQTSTGAISDLEVVTKRAYAMVAYYGMGEKMPNMSYYDSTGQSDYGFTKPYSEKTAELIDSEAKEIVAKQYERAKEILQENTPELKELAELLIEREVIFAEDMERIFGKRPWVSRNDELMAMNDAKMKQNASEAKEEMKEEITGIE